MVQVLASLPDDVDAVVEAAWFGLAQHSTGPVPRGMIGHREHALIPPKGDVEKARALLRESGVELPLRLRLDVNSDALEVTAVQVIHGSAKVLVRSIVAIPVVVPPLAEREDARDGLRPAHVPAHDDRFRGRR